MAFSASPYGGRCCDAEAGLIHLVVQAVVANGISLTGTSVRKYIMVVGLLLALAGCSDAGGDSSATGESGSRDSAGVNIVVSAAPAKPGDLMTVGPTPVLQIGKREGEPPYLFAQIGAVRRFADGSIAILESRAREVRIFGADGIHRTTFGRRGQGPGEFASTPELVVLPGDTLLTWDRTGARYSWFLPNGTLVREQKYSLEGAAALHTPRAMTAQWSLLPDGSLFVDDQMPPPMGPRIQTGEGSFTQGIAEDLLLNDRARIGFVLDSGTRSINLGENYPRGQYIVKNDFMVGNSFYPWSRFAPEGNPPRVHVSSPGIWEVRTIGADGALKRIARLGAARQALTREIVQQDLDADKARSKNPALVEELFNRLPRPDSIPPIYWVEVDRAGRLWLTGNPPADIPLYQLLDADGKWLGQVRGLSDWGYPVEFGDDYILTVWRDSMDVQHVRLYNLLAAPNKL